MIGLARDGASAMAFEVGLRRGVWRVLRDGAFYGDYPVRQSAMDAAAAAARLPLGRDPHAEIRIREEDT